MAEDFKVTDEIAYSVLFHLIKKPTIWIFFTVLGVSTIGLSYLGLDQYIRKETFEATQRTVTEIYCTRRVWDKHLSNELGDVESTAIYQSLITSSTIVADQIASLEKNANDIFNNPNSTEEQLEKARNMSNNAKGLVVWKNSYDLKAQLLLDKQEESDSSNLSLSSRDRIDAAVMEEEIDKCVIQKLKL